jgi:hypothetical protein
MNVYTGRDDFLADEQRRVLLNFQPFFSPALRIILFQDYDDFEVEGTLAYDDRIENNQGWYALIAWETRRAIEDADQSSS